MDHRLHLPYYSAHANLPRSFQGKVITYRHQCRQPGKGQMRLWRERQEAAERKATRLICFHYFFTDMCISKVVQRKARAAANCRRRIRIAVIYPLRVAGVIGLRRRCATLVQASCCLG